MFISMFNVNVREVNINELSTTIWLTDKEGNNVTLFFNSPDEVREFSRKIRRALLDKADIKSQEFERPALITD